MDTVLLDNLSVMGKSVKVVGIWSYPPPPPPLLGHWPKYGVFFNEPSLIENDTSCKERYESLEIFSTL